MRITADTNILVRALTGDDARQAALAEAELLGAEQVAMTLPCLCDPCWVLSSGYGHKPADIAQAVRRLIRTANVAVNRTAAEAGLAMLEAGRDFADGVIAHKGAWLGRDVFRSFDKRAVKRLAAIGVTARDLCR